LVLGGRGAAAAAALAGNVPAAESESPRASALASAVSLYDGRDINARYLPRAPDIAASRGSVPGRGAVCSAP
jgi:hypothetical protein